MNRICVLHSGFITYLGNNISLPDNELGTTELMNAIKFNQSIEEPDNLCFSKEIDNIMQDFYNTKNALNDFNFRERVLKLAKYIFNTNNFYEWCNLQQNSPHLSNLHIRFIIDTLNYVKIGNREISIMTWYNLLNAKSIKSSNPIEYNLKDLFNNNLNSNGLVSINSDDAYKEDNTSYLLNDVILLWTQQVNGISDLLLSLYVIFGSR